MRHERPCYSSARDGLHHRSLDLDESVRLHGSPQRLHQLAALQKNFPYFRIHHQIHIALAVAQFHIREPVPLLRQRQQIFAEERNLLDVNREFAGARAK